MGFTRVGIWPIWGPLWLRSSAHDTRWPVVIVAAAGPHGIVGDEVQSAELVVVAPASPIANLVGDLVEVGIERHRCLLIVS